MNRSEFTPQIQQWIMSSEGGYVNHPQDSGGPTNMGITIKTLSSWRGRQVSEEEVKNLSYSEAMDIYRANYWDAIQASRMPRGISYAVFDYAVNSGVARAAKDLQRTLGFTGRQVDGIVGVQTLGALEKITNVSAFIEKYCQTRWEFLKTLSNFNVFGQGWKRRIWGNEQGIQINSDNGVADRATKLALGLVTTQEPLPEVTEGKAEPQQATLWESLKNSETLSAIGGVLSIALNAIANQPILQVFTVVVIGYLLYKYIIDTKDKNLF